jgi:nucleoside-diphosphate-sugar epimerase
MIKIFLTGSNGFVGSNFVNKFKDIYELKFYFKKNIIDVKQDIIIHMAGKAHDLKKTSNPEEYFQVNTELTKKIFDAFLKSDAKVFIFLSSVKAVADEVEDSLTEECIPSPITNYGKSKLFAEQYILSKKISEDKRVYILRPCMVHGPGNKGNLNLLYKLVSKGIPWPLGAFNNNRSFCSIDNLLFIIKELIERDDIPSGVYNIADDEPLSTNDVIKLISKSLGQTTLIWNTPKIFIKLCSKVGDLFSLPLNTESLNKLTETYIVSNIKIKEVINKKLPLTAKDGLMKTLNSFKLLLSLIYLHFIKNI